MPYICVRCLTGLVTWHQGWPRLRTATAQKRAPSGLIWELGGLGASGPRVAVSGLGLIPLYAFSGPYEDVQLKS